MGQAIFNSNGSWPCPTGVTSARIQCFGCGGNGGQAGSQGGGGGGGGAYSESTLTITPGKTYTISIGAPGDSSYGVGAKFLDGSTVLVFAHTGSNGGSPGGGGGGIGGWGVGSIVYDGATGSDGSANGQQGGNGATGSGPGGVGIGGGAGGQGAQQFQYPQADPGSQPGGGGGGGHYATATSWGAGASGRVILTWTDPPSGKSQASVY